MLDLKFVRENAELVKKNSANKNKKVDIDAILKLDAARRALIQESETLKAQQNRESEAVAKEKDAAKRQEKIAALKKVKDDFKALELKLAAAEVELNKLLDPVPNIADADTPVGPDESGNIVVRKFLEPTKFDFEPKDHVALGEQLDLIDNELGAAVTGARFTYLKGDLVLLQQAIIQYVFALLTDRAALEQLISQNKLDLPATPFIPVIPPLMIKPEVMQRMARLEPREERYHIPSDDLYLIGSAEHTLGPMHLDETLTEASLPLRYVACTAAFRREAGSYGKDVRGILRVHQFDKIEMESFSLPEKSHAEQDLFVAIQEHLLQAFRIPYQVVRICTGDMGGPDARQIDIECWMPGQQRYRETHTSDLMTDYQSRRLNTRVKRQDGRNEFVHTNDATCVAMGRLIIAIMENFQTADGRIEIPEVLRPYMGGRSEIGGNKC